MLFQQSDPHNEEGEWVCLLQSNSSFQLCIWQQAEASLCMTLKSLGFMILWVHSIGLFTLIWASLLTLNPVRWAWICNQLLHANPIKKGNQLLFFRGNPGKEQKWSRNRICMLSHVTSLQWWWIQRVSRKYPRTIATAARCPKQPFSGCWSIWVERRLGLTKIGKNQGFVPKGAKYGRTNLLQRYNTAVYSHSTCPAWVGRGLWGPCGNYLIHV